MSNTLRASTLFCVYFLAPKWTRSLGCACAQSALFSPLRGNLLRKLSFSKALFYNLANASDKINFCVRCVKSGCRSTVFLGVFCVGEVFFYFAVFAATLFFAGKPLRMSNTLRAFFVSNRVATQIVVLGWNAMACVRRTGENLRFVGDRSIGVANLRKGLAPSMEAALPLSRAQTRKAGLGSQSRLGDKSPFSTLKFYTYLRG